MSTILSAFWAIVVVGIVVCVALYLKGRKKGGEAKEKQGEPAPPTPPESQG